MWMLGTENLHSFSLETEKDTVAFRALTLIFIVGGQAYDRYNIRLCAGIYAGTERGAAAGCHA